MINPENQVISTESLIEKPSQIALNSTDIAAIADHIIELPDKIGTGNNYILDLDDQNKLILSDVNFYQQTTFVSDNDYSLCGVFIVLEGRLNIEIEGSPPVSVTKNSAGLFFIGESQCRCIYPAGKTKLINFSITSKLMESLVQYNSDSPISQLSIDQWQITNCIWIMPITPEISDVVNQIYSNNLTAKAKKIYVQAKLMEVLTLLYQWHLQQSQYSELKPKDLNSIIRAARLIEEQMENPPSLIKLSRLVGINDNKLKKEFKLIFKCTVFDYLNQKRMEKAKSLLIKSDYSVKQVANAVGFKHPGHFAAKFKTKFNMVPNQFIKKHRRFASN